MCSSARSTRRAPPPPNQMPAAPTNCRPIPPPTPPRFPPAPALQAYVAEAISGANATADAVEGAERDLATVRQRVVDLQLEALAPGSLQVGGPAAASSGAGRGWRRGATPAACKGLSRRAALGGALGRAGSAAAMPLQSMRPDLGFNPSTAAGGRLLRQFEGGEGGLPLRHRRLPAAGGLELSFSVAAAAMNDGAMPTGRRFAGDGGLPPRPPLRRCLTAAAHSSVRLLPSLCRCWTACRRCRTTGSHWRTGWTWREWLPRRRPGLEAWQRLGRCWAGCSHKL